MSRTDLLNQVRWPTARRDSPQNVEVQVLPGTLSDFAPPTFGQLGVTVQDLARC
jgi:hypothetical protein